MNIFPASIIISDHLKILNLLLKILMDWIHQNVKEYYRIYYFHQTWKVQNNCGYFLTCWVVSKSVYSLICL